MEKPKYKPPPTHSFNLKARATTKKKKMEENKRIIGKKGEQENVLEEEKD